MVWVVTFIYRHNLYMSIATADERWYGTAVNWLLKRGNEAALKETTLIFSHGFLILVGTESATNYTDFTN
ncbi:MAG: hypothetical protein Kow0080_30440 [Candidatus Promineifilaceae bacterium]